MLPHVQLEFFLLAGLIFEALSQLFWEGNCVCALCECVRERARARATARERAREILAMWGDVS